MSTTRIIKDMLIQRIQSIDSVQVVYPSEGINPSGFPAVYIRAADIDSEFSSNTENSRIFGYKCTVIFPVSQDMIPEEEISRMDYAETVLGGVLDDIIDAIDKDFELDGAPVLYCNATDCQWLYVKFEGGEGEAIQFTIKVYTEKNISV